MREPMCAVTVAVATTQTHSKKAETGLISSLPSLLWERKRGIGRERDERRKRREGRPRMRKKRDMG